MFSQATSKVNSPSLNLQRHHANSFTWSNVGDLIGVEFLRKISMFRNFVDAIVPTHSLCQMLANAIGLEFVRKISMFKSFVVACLLPR